MIGAPNSLNLNCKVRVMKKTPGPSVLEEIADIFTNYDIDICMNRSLHFPIITGYFCPNWSGKLFVNSCPTLASDIPRDDNNDIHEKWVFESMVITPVMEE